MGISKAEETRRVNYHYMADAMRMLEWDLHSTILDRMRIPEEWHQIAREKPSKAKTRVTLRLDGDLVAFFRSMGPDWQVRVNRLMSVWMHARLAGLIRGGETMDYLARREHEMLDGLRPEFGDDERRHAAPPGPETPTGRRAPDDVPDVPIRDRIATMSPAARRALMEEMKKRNGIGEV
ncbi:BrnA antitoxin family protein [Paracoccus salsus]|uniref:BrnA antitoxin family protein n=1 Tax=Paracoccus salsus TaxID=2911061 RepID=UPI001F38DD29|nr:BrnA antitoxin family protein [Paracoccus salsus]MCF3974230.1 BrnA antitoxin family protein [Paracoccus salsus]